jgi:Flp pilus assembly protein TadG
MPARFSIARRLQDALDDTSASQIAEFAVALPLLLVMVVGIFDFGNAFNIKQKVTNTAREAARFGATQPTNDLSSVPPNSILAIRDLVVQDLQNGKLSDCGLGSAAATAAGASTPWKWTFTVACGTAGNLVLSVDRGNVFVTNTTISGGTPVKMIGTSVVLQYPYQWEFSRVIGLLVPGASYPGTSQISVNSFMENQS